MTLLSEIAKQALVRIRVQNPRFSVDSVHSAQVLEVIQNFILGHPSLGYAGDFNNVDVSGGTDDDYTAREFDRIRVLSGTTSDITLPESVEVTDAEDAYETERSSRVSRSSGATTRPPVNGARVIILGADVSENDVNELWIYIRSMGKWNQIDSLTLADANPLGPDMDGPLVTIAAYMVAENYSSDGAKPQLQTAYRMAMGRIAQAFDDQGQTNQEYF